MMVDKKGYDNIIIKSTDPVLGAGDIVILDTGTIFRWAFLQLEACLLLRKHLN